MWNRLAELSLLVVTGKGGVGKTALTAALGRLLSAAGRSVMLIEVDPRENLHQLLDTEPSGGEIVEVSPRLYLQHLEPREILDDLVREKLRLGIVARRVLSSPIHQHFTEGAPGLKEAAVFGRALRLLRGHCPRHVQTPDVVILDAPATGHGVSMMTAPRLVSEVIQSGPIGHMAAEIAAFLEDESASGVVVATTAEEMPVQEALELIDDLREQVSRRPELVVVNALYPPFPEHLVEDEAMADPSVSLWHERRQINENELERLDARWQGPMAELPLLPLEPGPALVGALGRRLEQQLRGRS